MEKAPECSGAQEGVVPVRITANTFAYFTSERVLKVECPRESGSLMSSCCRRVFLETTAPARGRCLFCVQPVNTARSLQLF